MRKNYWKPKGRPEALSKFSSKKFIFKTNAKLNPVSVTRLGKYLVKNCSETDIERDRHSRKIFARWHWQTSFESRVRWGEEDRKISLSLISLALYSSSHTQWSENRGFTRFHGPFERFQGLLFKKRKSYTFFYSLFYEHLTLNNWTYMFGVQLEAAQQSLEKGV